MVRVSIMMSHGIVAGGTPTPERRFPRTSIAVVKFE